MPIWCGRAGTELESGLIQGAGEIVRAHLGTWRHGSSERNKQGNHPQFGRIPKVRQVIYLMRIILINRGNGLMQVNCFDSKSL